MVLETMAHTLAATLGFLALHKDIQKEVYEQIISVVGPDRDPVCVVQVFLRAELSSLFTAKGIRRLSQVRQGTRRVLRSIEDVPFVHPAPFHFLHPWYRNAMKPLAISWSVKPTKILCYISPTHMGKKG